MSFADEAESVRRLFSTAGHIDPSDPNRDVISQMGLNRSVNMRKSGVANSISLATGRPTDPMFYWRNANLPYNIWEKDELSKVRSFCRMLYLLHPVIASAIDIFSKYPLVGMEILSPKDDKITDFYNELFFNELDYEEFLVDVGREYWTAGEAWAFGTFNELLGVWESDELLQPDDIKVVRSPFLREPRYEMRLPQHIRDIIRDRKPEWEYKQLITAYPEMASLASLGELTDEDDPRGWMPVSNTLLYHLKFKGDTFHDRGVPILMRAFRSVMQEEMLNAAQDAIASRLYTPLILAKLGASAGDLGTNAPWIPSQADLDAFNESLNAALAADFRVMTHHFAVNMSNVFGRESMPNLNGDFERITERILQTFGMSKTMLSGASGGQTYAADALNRDLLSQLLVTYQKRIARFFKKRAEVVAEAQGHYDFELKGGRPIPIMEEVIEVDEETGNQRIVEQPKLLVPDLKIRYINMRDQDSYRQFLEALRATGVPISQRTRMVNVPINLDEEAESVKTEQVTQAVLSQEARKETYLELRRRGLPIPQDLIDDFMPRVDDSKSATTPEILPSIGRNEPAPTVGLVPTEEDLASAGTEATGPIPDVDMSDVVIKNLPRNRMTRPRNIEEQGNTPYESHEQRAGMPRASSLDPSVQVDPILVDGEEVARTVMSAPNHIGMRAVASKESFYLYQEEDEVDEESDEASD